MNNSTKLDKKLSVALGKYQKRHGLKVTGSFTKQVANKLNDPLAKRIAQLKLNLERRRWENRKPAKHHAYMNLAGGKLKLTLADKTIGLLTVSNADLLSGLPSQYGNISGFRNKAGRLAIVTQLIPASGEDSAEVNFEISGSAKIVATVFKKLLPPVQLQKLKTLGVDKAITLPQPIELYLTYLTALADRQGVVSFRNDIAKRDPRLKAALDITLP